MWIRLARNRFWITFCVIVTAVMFVRDNWKAVAEQVPQKQTVPKAVAQMRSPEPLYPTGESAILPDGSRVRLTHNKAARRTFGKPNEQMISLGVRHEATAEVPLAWRLQPETGDWVEGIGPGLDTTAKGAVVSGEYLFNPVLGVQPSLSYATAWLSEAQVVAEYDPASDKWFAHGMRADAALEASSESVEVVLTLSDDMRLALYEQNRAYAIILVDKLGAVHRSWQDTLNVMDGSSYSSEQIKLAARFKGINKSDVKRVRFVAAPLHWVRFHRARSPAEKKLAAKGIYVVPKLFRGPLRRRGDEDLRSDAGIERGTVIAEVTTFLPIQTARGVPDAVVVSAGRGDGHRVRDGDGATFTLFLPGYMAESVSLAVYDANGRTNSQYSGGTWQKRAPTGQPFREVYVFPEFRQEDVKRLVITAR